MKNFIAIMFIVFGLVPLILYTINEKDRETFFKIMIAASCGVMVIGGIIGLMI